MPVEMVTKILNWAFTVRKRGDSGRCEKLWILADAVEDYLPWIREARYREIVEGLLAEMQDTDEVREIREYLEELWGANQEA